MLQIVKFGERAGRRTEARMGHDIADPRAVEPDLPIVAQ